MPLARPQEVVTQWAEGLGEAHVCGVKRRARAIEKVHRTYNGHASKLVDLVRSGVSFDDASSMAACLERIRTDPRCAVLSVKNWFDPKFTAETGYRKVGLTLIVVDPCTMSKGVERHICELILSFVELDRQKQEGGGHKRYVEWRDTRVE